MGVVPARSFKTNFTTKRLIMNASEHLYEVSVNWVADRKGIMSSPELNNSLEVATPPQFPKEWKLVARTFIGCSG